jgi:hypothetical protein
MGMHTGVPLLPSSSQHISKYSENQKLPFLCLDNPLQQAEQLQLPAVMPQMSSPYQLSQVMQDHCDPLKTIEEIITIIMLKV